MPNRQEPRSQDSESIRVRRIFGILVLFGSLYQARQKSSHLKNLAIFFKNYDIKYYTQVTRSFFFGNQESFIILSA